MIRGLGAEPVGQGATLTERYPHRGSGVHTGMNTAGIGDDSLARAAAAGDLAAFEALVRRHQHQLYRDALDTWARATRPSTRCRRL